MKSTQLRFVENNVAFDIFEFIRFNEKSDIYTVDKYLLVNERWKFIRKLWSKRLDTVNMYYCSL